MPGLLGGLHVVVLPRFLREGAFLGREATCVQF